MAKKAKKTVSFKKPKPASADEWVAATPEKPQRPAERTKRFTIDVPRSLHTALKIECAKRDQIMVDVLRDLIELYVQGRLNDVLFHFRSVRAREEP
jgi:hypothetical protein